GAGSTVSGKSSMSAAWADAPNARPAAASTAPSSRALIPGKFFLRGWSRHNRNRPTAPASLKVYDGKKPATCHFTPKHAPDHIFLGRDIRDRRPAFVRCSQV